MKTLWQNTRGNMMGIFAVTFLFVVGLMDFYWTTLIVMPFVQDPLGFFGSSYFPIAVRVMKIIAIGCDSSYNRNTHWELGSSMAIAALIRKEGTLLRFFNRFVRIYSS